MQLSLRLKWLSFITLMFGGFSLCHAHYALECYEYTPEITTIDCHHYRCHWNVQEAADKHIDTRTHRDHLIEKYCTDDMITTSLMPFDEAEDSLEYFAN